MFVSLFSSCSTLVVCCGLGFVWMLTCRVCLFLLVLVFGGTCWLSGLSVSLLGWYNADFVTF